MGHGFGLFKLSFATHILKQSRLVSDFHQHSNRNLKCDPHFLSRNSHSLRTTTIFSCSHLQVLSPSSFHLLLNCFSEHMSVWVSQVTSTATGSVILTSSVGTVTLSTTDIKTVVGASNTIA